MAKLPTPLEFVSQEDLLSLADFEDTCKLVTSLDRNEFPLVFYNSGPLSGARFVGAMLAVMGAPFSLASAIGTFNFYS